MFLMLSVTGGSLMAAQIGPALWLMGLSGVGQILCWIAGDRRFAARGHSLGTATGLAPIGQVRSFEPPHTGTNYLLREMVYVIARKHAVKLRVISILFMSVIPLVLLSGLSAGHLSAGLSLGFHICGVLLQRWLFFAEAEHVVGLYYGAHQAGRS